MISRGLYRKMAKVLVACCNGSEEIETVTPVDLLRRAGAEVTLAASGDSLLVTLSRGIKLSADTLLRDLPSDIWDMVVVPGGPGASLLRDDSKLTEILNINKQNNKWIASICASPAVVLQAHGLLEGLKATCYPGVAEQLPGRLNERVVVDGKVITSQGAGTSVEFSLQLIKSLFGDEKEREVAERIISHT